MGGIFGSVAGAALGSVIPGVGTALGAQIGGGLGGMMEGDKGSKKAAAYQNAAANQQLELQKRMYEETTQRYKPYYDIGTGGLRSLGQLMGVDDPDQRKAIEDRLRGKYTTGAVAATQGTAGAWNAAKERELQQALIQWNSKEAGGLQPEAQSWRGIAEALMAEKAGAGGGTAATAGKAGTVDQAALDAAVDAEIAKSRGGRFGELTKRYGAEDYKADPGYAFRLAEGEKARDRANAARGGFFGGKALREASRYGQEMGSQEYGNAFDRWRSQNSDIYGRLSGLAGIGSAAAGNQATAGQAYGSAFGDITTGRANAMGANAIQQQNTQNQSMAGVMQGLGGLFGSNTGGMYGGGYGNYGSAGRIDWYK